MYTEEERRPRVNIRREPGCSQSDRSVPRNSLQRWVFIRKRIDLKHWFKVSLYVVSFEKKKLMLARLHNKSRTRQECSLPDTLLQLTLHINFDTNSSCFKISQEVTSKSHPTAAQEARTESKPLLISSRQIVSSTESAERLTRYVYPHTCNIRASRRK